MGRSDYLPEKHSNWGGRSSPVDYEYIEERKIINDEKNRKIEKYESRLERLAYLRDKCFKCMELNNNLKRKLMNNRNNINIDSFYKIIEDNTERLMSIHHRICERRNALIIPDGYKSKIVIPYLTV